MSAFVQMMELAVLQGVAEFLPISSSGHLVILQKLIGVNSPGESLEIILHFGTLLSILLYYRQEIRRLISGIFKKDRAAWSLLLYIALSALPAVFFYLFCGDRVDAAFKDVRAVGGLLVFTGVVLTLLRWIPCGNGGLTSGRSLLIGIAQAIAVLPGVSRSGMTIASARMAGVAPDKAAEFSFLMLIPLILGAMMLTGKKLVKAPADMQALLDVFPAWTLLLGVAVSAAIGYFSLAFLVRLLRGGRFWLFGVYCLAAGLLTVLFM